MLILHGWGADSTSNWFPWLKQQLEQKGITAYCPNLPSSMLPRKAAWLEAARKAVGKYDESLSIIGHSLGAVAILRILESFGKGEKIDKAILVSGFAKNVGLLEINDFFRGAYDFVKIRKNANKFFVINSDDDPFVPLSYGEEMAKQLNAKFLVEHKAGHINAGTGHLSYQRVLELLEEKNES
ncbi:MAG: alpha/beta fold hydrolase [Candidatus Micrarchaeota archaeon]